MAKEFTRFLRNVAKNPELAKAVRAALEHPIGQELAAKASTAAAAAIKRRLFREDAAADAAPATDAAISHVALDEDPGMSTIGEIEEAVLRVEKVNIRFVHRENQRGVRNDRRVYQPYAYVNRLGDDFTAAELVNRRLATYQEDGIKIVVCDRRDVAVNGNTKLATLRYG